MEERLKELKRRYKQVACELDSINQEINGIERKMLDSDKALYKGKWFFKKESWWDEFDVENNNYNIVYIQSVRFEYGRTLLSVVKFEFDHYCVLRDINIERDYEFFISELNDMKEMTEYEFEQMDETFKQLISCLFEIRPSLKSKFKKQE